MSKTRNHFRTKIAIVALAATACTPLTGCGFIFRAIAKSQEAGKQKEFDKKLAAAKQKGDVATITSMCQHKPRRSTRFTRKNKQRACQALFDVKLKELETSSCGKSIEHYENFKKNRYYGSYRKAKQVYYSGAIRLAKCKNWDYLFAHFMSVYSRRSQELLNKVEASGIPLEKEVISWVQKQEQPFSFKRGIYASVQLTRWLKSKDKKYCSTFIKALRKTKESNKRSILNYLSASKCEGLAPIAAKLLQSENGRVREEACRVLGRVGNKRHLKKINALRFYDPAFYLKGKYIKYKVYYVRAACRGAVGKIRVRMD